MMRSDYAQLTDDALLLNRYLGQYKHCINVKRNLEVRLRDIRFEFDHPLSSVRMDGMPRGNATGVGCASLTLRLDEIETKIKEQIDRSMKVLRDIMAVIELLPDNSMERIIIEHRYIDRMSWDKITIHENIGRTPAIRWWRKGMFELLENDSVRKILKDYAEEIARAEAADIGR